MGQVFDGPCRLCGDTYTGTGISSHVKRCLTEHADIAAIHHGLLVGARADGPAGRFWMYLLVRPEARLTDLDDYLREVWFDDDDRLSAFDVGDVRYLDRSPQVLQTATDDDENADGDDSDGDDDTPSLERMSDVDLGEVIRPRMELTYAYAPRRATEVELRVFDPYPCPETLVDGDDTPAAVLVARNAFEPECSTCGTDATVICLECLHVDDTSDESDEGDGSEGESRADDEVDDDSPTADGEDGDDDGDEHSGPYACDECAGRHDGPMQELVNGPRLGMPEPTSED